MCLEYTWNIGLYILYIEKCPELAVEWSWRFRTCQWCCLFVRQNFQTHQHTDGSGNALSKTKQILTAQPRMPYDLMQMVGLHLKEFQQLLWFLFENEHDCQWLTGPQERYLLGLALLHCHVAPSAIRTTISRTKKTKHLMNWKCLSNAFRKFRKIGNCRPSNVWPGGSPIYKLGTSSTNNASRCIKMHQVRL